MNYCAHEIEQKWPKSSSFNWRLIPKKLEELAKQGVYFDDRVLPVKSTMSQIEHRLVIN